MSEQAEQLKKRGRTQNSLRMIGIVLEEADETQFWLDFLVATSIVTEVTVKSHRCEASELSAIFTASHKTACSHKRTKAN